MSEKGKQSVYISVDIPGEVMARIREVVTEEVRQWLASPQFEHASREAVRMATKEFLSQRFNVWSLREKANPLSEHLVNEVETQMMKMFQVAAVAKVEP